MVDVCTFTVFIYYPKPKTFPNPPKNHLTMDIVIHFVNIEDFSILQLYFYIFF